MRATKKLPQAEHAKVFSALGDKTRLQLLSRIGTEGPRSISELATRTAVSRQAVTKHLEVLEGAGLVHSQWHGRKRLWVLDNRQFEIARKFLDHMSYNWTGRLNRLSK